MRIPKIKNLRKKLEKIPEKISRNAFLTFLILFFIFLILGGLAYYKYLILEATKEPQVLERVFEFDPKKYRQVLEILDEKEREFSLIEFKEFRDPFEILLKTETSTIMFLPSPWLNG